MNPIPQWCKDVVVQRVYSGRIRDGKFTQLTAENYEVWECETTRLQYFILFLGSIIRMFPTVFQLMSLRQLNSISACMRPNSRAIWT